MGIIWNSGIFLILGNAGFISSTEAPASRNQLKERDRTKNAKFHRAS